MQGLNMAKGTAIDEVHLQTTTVLAQNATQPRATQQETMKKTLRKKTALQAVALKTATLKKPPRKRALPQPKEMELSVTISVGSDDISLDLLAKVEEFIEKECLSGLCSIERGGAMCRLHMQMVCRLFTTSAVMATKRLKTYLGWDDAKKAPVGHHILTKTLRNTGLHTFIGMLGYCIKDKGEEHFQCVHRNVTYEQIEEGVEEYIKYGTPFAKNKIVLTHTNLMERAATYCRYKLRKQLGSTLPGTLLPMLRSGQYIPSASWVLPVRQGGMQYNRASSLWKCMMNPHTVEMDDVTQIFFEHTNPGSRLADLGRQRLAGHLDDAREGAQHEYIVPADDQEYSQRDWNDIIVVNDSQDPAPTNANLPDTVADEDPEALAAPMYIPVFWGERDVENCLVV